MDFASQFSMHCSGESFDDGVEITSELESALFGYCDGDESVDRLVRVQPTACVPLSSR